MANSNEYMREYMAKRRAKRRAELERMSGNKCARETCTTTENLEFNHLDRTTKLFQLDKAGLDQSWDKIVAEWAKCELVCRKHHNEYTKQQWDNGEMPTVHNSRKHEPQIHGTLRCYNETGCRCIPCKYAKKLGRAKLISYNEVVNPR